MGTQQPYVCRGGGVLPEVCGEGQAQGQMWVKVDSSEAAEGSSSQGGRRKTRRGAGLGRC